jgi:hypothetical protein
MTTPEKILFYRRVLDQMEVDFERWEISGTKPEIEYLKNSFKYAEIYYLNGNITDPHPRQLPGGRIAKRWEWWLHKTFPKLFTLEE